MPNHAPCLETPWGSADIAPDIFKLGFPQILLSNIQDDGFSDGGRAKQEIKLPCKKIIKEKSLNFGFTVITLHVRVFVLHILHSEVSSFVFMLNEQQKPSLRK